MLFLEGLDGFIWLPGVKVYLIFVIKLHKLMVFAFIVMQKVMSSARGKWAISNGIA